MATRAGVTIELVRRMGTGIYGLNMGAALTGASKLNRMINDDTKRRKKKIKDLQANARLNNPRFEVSDKMRHFNKSLLHNINLIRSGPILRDLVQMSAVTFLEVQVRPTFDQAFIMWRSTGCKDESSLGKLEAKLNDIAPQIRHELTQLQALGAIPKLVFIQDYREEERKFIDSLATFRADTTEDMHEPYLNVTLKTDVLNFNREEVLNKILNALDKAKATHRK